MTKAIEYTTQETDEQRPPIVGICSAIVVLVCAATAVLTLITMQRMHDHQYDGHVAYVTGFNGRWAMVPMITATEWAASIVFWLFALTALAVAVASLVVAIRRRRQRLTWGHELTLGLTVAAIAGVIAMPSAAHIWLFLF